MHSRKRGAAKSRKPNVKTAPAWVKTTTADIESIVEKLAKEGKTPSQIGQILRDVHGVPSTKLVAGKKLGKILDEKKLTPKIPADMMSLIRRAVGMMKHMSTNKKDKLNRQKLSHVEAKIKRLVRYYRGNKLPKDWKYEADKAELLVK